MESQSSLLVATFPTLKQIFDKVDGIDVGFFGPIHFRYHPNIDGHFDSFEKTTNFAYTKDGDNVEVFFDIVFDNYLLDSPLHFTFLIPHEDDEEYDAQVWISEWWHISGTCASRFEIKEGRNHPFVLSWNCFLDATHWRKAINDFDSFGGYINFLSLKKGLKLLEDWIDWIIKYSQPV